MFLAGLPRSFALVLIVGLVAEACGPAASSVSSPPPGSPVSPGAAAELTVYAAASLKAALVRAVAAYELGHPGTEIALSTDASSALATQIQQGAPADVFLSADTSNPQRLVDAGLAVAPVRPVARNQLVVIVPAGNPAHVATPLDLGRPGLKVIAAGDSVPITGYATQLIRNLAAASPSAKGLAAAYEANVVSKEDNVAAVVTKVALAEGDAAIVYATDASSTSKVEAIAVPAAENVIATYGGVVIRASSRLASAQAFLDWLAGPDAQAILASFGFLTAS